MGGINLAALFVAKRFGEGAGFDHGEIRLDGELPTAHTEYAGNNSMDNSSV